MSHLSKLVSTKTQRTWRTFTWQQALLAVILSVFLQIVLIETIQRASLLQCVSWLFQQPVVFLLNLVMGLMLIFLCIFLTGSLTWSLILSSFVILLFALADRVKRQLLGEPLFPWDFGRLDQVLDLIPQYKREVLAALLVLALMISLLTLAAKILLPKIRTGWKVRLLLLLLISVVIPLSIFYRHTPIEASLKQMGIENIYWQQSENSLTNGLLLGFIMNMENTMVFEPPSYSEAAVKQLLEQNRPGIPAMGKDSQVQPDIILVLNESFWDPTLLPGVSFSEDPLPYFRALCASHPSGTIVTPVFGGSTANAEYEILSGLSTYFLPQGAIAYQQYINKPLPALPSLLCSQGYSATAVHPYHDWFYKRNAVYPLLGFERFLSLKDFVSPQIKGEYTSDLDVMEQILQVLRDSDQPAFILAVTMQNHGPYPAERYSEKTIHVQGPLSKEGKEILETYAQGVKDADDALRYLIRQLEASGDPALVVFLGDHLPYLGKDYQVYRETGFISGSEKDWSLKERLLMKAVPAVLWSNRPLPHSRDFGYLSASYLGSYLLEAAGLEANALFHFNRQLSEKIPVLTKTVSGDEQEISANIPPELEKDAYNYWLIEYDILFGSRYFLTESEFD